MHARVDLLDVKYRESKRIQRAGRPDSLNDRTHCTRTHRWRQFCSVYSVQQLITDDPTIRKGADEYVADAIIHELPRFRRRMWEPGPSLLFQAQEGVLGPLYLEMTALRANNSEGFILSLKFKASFQVVRAAMSSPVPWTWKAQLFVNSKNSSMETYNTLRRFLGHQRWMHGLKRTL